MITPVEFQNKTFKTGIGYDKRDVDHFVDQLLAEYENLYKENMELNDKINTLNEGISYYKSIEKTLQKALVLAEKTAEETKEAAQKQAKIIEAEARTKAQLILADANNELNKLQQKIIQLISQYESYKAQFKHLAAAQCELLESDSFQIHIADLDLFTKNEERKETSNEIHSDEIPANEINSNEISNDSFSCQKLDSESGNPEPIQEETASEKFDDEDFEFFNIDDEQE